MRRPAITKINCRHCMRLRGVCGTTGTTGEQGFGMLVASTLASAPNKLIRLRGRVD